MNTHPSIPSSTASAAPRSARRHARRLLMGSSAAMLLALVVPAASKAKVTTIGSPLSVPATLNTSENLSYPGTNTQVPPAPDAPNGIFHTSHFGADTALWNFSNASGADPRARHRAGLEDRSGGLRAEAPTTDRRR